MRFEIRREIVRGMEDALRARIVELEQELRDTKARARLERAALKAEMRAELVDRQANAARVADRQRALFERGVAQSGQLQASERAKASAGYIEAALTTLCPFSVAQPGGCNELA